MFRPAAARATARWGYLVGAGAAGAAVVAGAVTAAGLTGVSVFAEDVKRWPDLLPEAELDVALRSLTAFVEKAGTGGGLFRRLQSQFCFDVARHTDVAELTHAGTAVLRSADGWSALAAAGRSQGTTIDRWRSVAEVAATLPAQEESAVSTMEVAAAALEPMRSRRIHELEEVDEVVGLEHVLVLRPDDARGFVGWGRERIGYVRRKLEPRRA